MGDIKPQKKANNKCMRSAKNIKMWYSVAKPNNLVWFFQFFFAFLASVFKVVSSVPSANAISSLVVFDQEGATKNIVASFVLLALYAICWHIQYLLDSKQLSHIYPKIQNKVFEKVFSADDSNFVYSSREKLINIISNNTIPLSDFCDFSSIKFSCLFEFVILLVVMFLNSLYVGLTILACSLAIYLLIHFASRGIAKRNLSILGERDKLSETFSDIIQNRIIGQDFNLKSSLKNRYSENVSSIIKQYKKRTRLKSFRDNFIYLFYTSVVFVLTLYLSKLVCHGTINLTIFLFLVPYLTSAIDKIMCFCNISEDIEESAINAMRVKSLLEMPQKEFIEFGKNTETDIDGAITFSFVSYSSEDKPNKTLGTIKPFFAQILHRHVALFQGEKGCGKRAIFYMLRRDIRPDTGTITLDTINIYDFSQERYVSFVNYVTAKPYFYTGTIEQNLKLISQSKRKIVEACKIAKLHDKIMSLPNTYQTLIQDNENGLSTFEKFQLSIARAVLASSDVILFYEFPPALTDQEKQTIFSILKTLKKEKTIIIFSALNLFPELTNKHFIVENNTVKEEKTTTQTPKNIKVDSKFSK